MTGGELASFVIVDAVARLVPGVLGGGQTLQRKRPSKMFWLNTLILPGLLYLRVRKCLEVLLSGNHRAIEEYRLEDSLKRTFLKRPDLLFKRTFSEPEKAIIKKWCIELEQIIKT